MGLKSFAAVLFLGFITSCGGSVSLNSPGPQPSPNPPQPPIEREEGGFSVLSFESRGIDIPGLDLDHFDVVTLDLQNQVFERLRPPIAAELHLGESPKVSADGRFVVFSYKTMTNAGGYDTGIWKFDRILGTYERVSISGIGNPPPLEAMKDTTEPSTTDDAQVVVFSSFQPNLVPGETTQGNNIFMKDFSSTLLYWISRSSSGGNLVNSQREMNFVAAQPRISGQGRYVVYASNATNLLPGVDDGEWDVFLMDRSSGVTERISQMPDGSDVKSHAWDPDLSDDGSVVVFQTLTNHSVNYDYHPYNATMGPRCWGRELDPAYERVHWLCGATQILLKDRNQNRIEAISVDPSGRMATEGRSFSPRISKDGRFVAFYSSALNLRLLPHINSFPSGGSEHTLFLRDRLTQEIIHIGAIAPRGIQFSPDGLELFYISEGKGYLVRTKSRRIRRIF